MTRRPIDPRQFVALWALGLIGVAASMPTLVETGAPGSDGAPAATPWIVLRAAVRQGVLLAGAVGVGLALGPQLGLRAPFLGAWLSNETPPDPRPVVVRAVALGVIAGVAAVALDRFAFASQDAVGRAIVASSEPSPLVGVLAAIEGGTAHEILARFGVMTAVVWVLWRVRSGPDGTPRPWMHWIGILLAALVFALVQFTGSPQPTGLAEVAIGGAIAVNGFLGVVFGWLYWNRGLEAAMLAHLAAGLVVYVGAPALL